MVTRAGDIIKTQKIEESKTQDNLNLSNLESKIYKTLQLEPMGLDEIALKIEGNIVEIGSILSMMSLKGLITESGGKYYLSNTS